MARRKTKTARIIGEQIKMSLNSAAVREYLERDLRNTELTKSQESEMRKYTFGREGQVRDKYHFPSQ